MHAAGGVIQGFGQFVAGNEIVVGAIIFSIVVIIQFVVITKGATRISEVAARFTLDGMPGRQMAIDADVGAGNIDQPEAQRRRIELSRQADFYGAMDGASKFVRGDAIAGLMIMAVNVLGGLVLGVGKAGMPLTEALGLYTKLAIGDGLVSQLPAFLISLAAGLLITRSTQATDLPVEFIRQVFFRPEPLLVAGGFLSVLIFAQLPPVPLLLVGGACVGIAVALRQQAAGSQSASAEETPPDGVAERGRTKPAAAARVEDHLNVDPIELELGLALVRLADPKRGGNLLEAIGGIRNRVAAQLGFVMPQVRIRDNLQLGENEYRFKLNGSPIASGSCYPLRAFVAGPDAARLVDGISGRDPLTGRRGLWIDPSLLNQLSAAEPMSANDYLVGHLHRIVARHADELLTRDATQKLIERTRQQSPAIVDELLPAKLGLGDVQRVLKNLLRERIAIKNLPLILEAMSDYAGSAPDLSLLTERVRQRLARSISAQFSNSDGQLPALALSAELEDWLSLAIEDGAPRSSDRHDFESRIHEIIGRYQFHRRHAPVLIVRQGLRRLLRARPRRSIARWSYWATRKSRPVSMWNTWKLLAASRQFR